MIKAVASKACGSLPRSRHAVTFLETCEIEIQARADSTVAYLIASLSPELSSCSWVFGVESLADNKQVRWPAPGRHYDLWHGGDV